MSNKYKIGDTVYIPIVRFEDVDYKQQKFVAYELPDSGVEGMYSDGERIREFVLLRTYNRRFDKINFPSKLFIMGKVRIEKIDPHSWGQRDLEPDEISVAYKKIINPQKSIVYTPFFIVYAKDKDLVISTTIQGNMPSTQKENLQNYVNYKSAKNERLAIFAKHSEPYKDQNVMSRKQFEIYLGLGDMGDVVFAL